MLEKILQSPHHFHLDLIGMCFLQDELFLIDKNFFNIIMLLIQIKLVPLNFFF